MAGLSCSFQGVTTDEIVEAILELELCFFSLAMIAVAGPKLDSRRLYMAELMLIGYEAVRGCTRVTKMLNPIRNIAILARRKSLDDLYVERKVWVQVL